MKIEQYIITDEVKITFVDAGYIIEVGGGKYEGLIGEFEDWDTMIDEALEELAILAAEYYDDDDYHDNVVLPAIHALETKLLS